MGCIGRHVIMAILTARLYLLSAFGNLFLLWANSSGVGLFYSSIQRNFFGRQPPNGPVFWIESLLSIQSFLSEKKSKNVAHDAVRGVVVVAFLVRVFIYGVRAT